MGGYFYFYYFFGSYRLGLIQVPYWGFLMLCCTTYHIDVEFSTCAELWRLVLALEYWWKFLIVDNITMQRAKYCKHPPPPPIFFSRKELKIVISFLWPFNLHNFKTRALIVRWNCISGCWHGIFWILCICVYEFPHFSHIYRRNKCAFRCSLIEKWVGCSNGGTSFKQSDIINWVWRTSKIIEFLKKVTTSLFHTVQNKLKKNNK